jgi:hypothetical protein
MFKSSTEEHTRIVQNGGMGQCEFKSSKRKLDLRLARDCEGLVCSRDVFLVHELDRRCRLSRSIAAISAASDQGFAQEDVRIKSGRILATSGRYPGETTTVDRRGLGNRGEGVVVVLSWDLGKATS